jgi:hypothetical protein
MSDLNEFGEKTRRAVLKALGGTAGLAAAGGASAHGWGETNSTANENDSVKFGKPKTQGLSENARVHGYHSIGGIGPSSESGQPDDPHYGGLTEIAVHGEYVYQSMFSARNDTGGRGFAILDASDYVNAESEAELEAAELSVESIFRDLNGATACMDLKLDDTGDYVFIGTQPIAALFDELGESPMPDPNASSASGVNSGGVLAVDVSDKSSPSLSSVAEIPSTGIHNLYHHRIGDSEYVFACKDINYVGDSGVYIYEFDRTLGTLTLVNQFTPNGDLVDPNDELDSGGFNFYCHDITIQDDPKTGTPTAYLSYWNAGLMILDVSDPSSLEQVGLFPMLSGHFAIPAPDTVTDADGNERRVAFASHERPSVNFQSPNEDLANPGSTGTIYLVDTDDIYETDGVAECGELANWAWQDEVAYSDFNLSPHNSQPAIYDGELWLHQSHYHGGTRFLKVEVGSERGTTLADKTDLGGGIHVTSSGRGSLSGGEDLPIWGERPWTVIDGVPNDRANDATDWELTEGGFSRPYEPEIPEDSKMGYTTSYNAAAGGLSNVQPFVWGAVQNRGVTFAGDINQGVYAIKQDDIPLKGAMAETEGTRETGRILADGQPASVELAIETDQSVLVRDRVSSALDVEADAAYERYDLGGQTAVEFETAATDGTRLSYEVAVPAAESETELAFGPIEISDDGGETWRALSGTIETTETATFALPGSSTSLTLGTAAGATAITYSQRERFREGFERLFGDEE